MSYTHSDYQKAADVILSRTSLRPKIGLVLGSGLGILVDSFEDKTVIPYADIQGMPQSTVHGHSGNFVIGKFQGHAVIAQQGRTHFYEGYNLSQVTFAVRIMYFLGVDTLILTNAAGGLNPEYNVGELMLIEDHINFPGMTGNNPLMGPNDESIGPRFVGLVQTYDRALRKIALEVAAKEDIPLHQGVYVGLSGPSFETPAEIRMLRVIGGNTVGMSTVHEAIVARHAGMRVLAFSGITNVAIDSTETDFETNHEEVLEAGKIIVPRMTTVLKGVLRALEK